MNDFRIDSSVSPQPIGAPPPLDWLLQQPTTRARVRYAGFWRRFFAGCIDSLLLAIVNLVLTRIVDRFFDAMAAGSSPDVELSTWLTASVLVPQVVWWLYSAGMQSSYRQATIGKIALGIIVTDLQGNRISFARGTARFAASYLSAFLLLLGYLIQPFTAKRQALHDLIAGTLVVRS